MTEKTKKYRALWMRKWREKNPGKHREYQKKAEWQARLTVLKHYSNNKPKCACCGENYLMMLAIDHIKGNGGEMRRNKIHGSGYSLWRYLIKNNFPVGYQVLCHGCNMGKSFYGFCPHTTKNPKLILVGQKRDGRWDEVRGIRPIKILKTT